MVEIILVFAFVFAAIAALFVSEVSRPPIVLHFGWLAIAFYLLSVILGSSWFGGRHASLFISSAYAQTASAAPTFVWKIVLKTFLNKVEAVRTESYPDKNTCELARVGMDLSNLNLLGVHGECVFVPTTYGRKYHRPLKSKG